jgi:hypothetical protein
MPTAIGNQPWRQVTLCLVVVALFAFPAADQARAGPPGSAPTAPLNGVFDSCPPELGQLCVDRLATARQMGFGLVINGAGLASGPQAARDYAQAASQLGMRLAWHLADEDWWIDYQPGGQDLLLRYPLWTASCTCLTNAELLRYIVTTLAGLPATWGWYAADDLQLRQSETVGPVKAWTQRLKDLAPQEATVIAVWNTMSWYRDVADFVAQESYPFGLPGSSPSWSDIAELARRTERLTPGRSSFILQGFSWGDNIWDAQAVGVCAVTEPPQTCLPKLRYPTAREQRRQRQTVLLNSRPSLLLWYGLTGTIGPYQPNNDPNYSDPTPPQASARGNSLSAAVLAPPPTTRACLRVQRRHGRWILDARASRALGGVRTVRWRARGWLRKGRGLRISLQAARRHPSTSVSLLLRDGYRRSARIRASLRPGEPMRCRRLPAIKGW